MILSSSAYGQAFTVSQFFPPPGGPSPRGTLDLFDNAPPPSFQIGFSTTIDLNSTNTFNCTLYLLNNTNGALLDNSQNIQIFNYTFPPPLFLTQSFMGANFAPRVMANQSAIVSFNWSVGCYYSNGTFLNWSTNRTINLSLAQKVFSGNISGSDGMNFQFSSGPPTPIGFDTRDVGPVVGNNMNLSSLSIKDAPGSQIVMIEMSVAGDRVGKAMALRQPPDFSTPLAQFDGNGTQKTPFCSGNSTLTPETDMQYYLYVDFDGNQNTGCAINTSEVNSTGYDFQIFFNASQYGSQPQFRNCTVIHGNFSDPGNYTVIPNVVDMESFSTCSMAGIAEFRINTVAFANQTGLGSPNLTSGLGFMGEIGNGSGVQDSFSQRMLYTPGSIDFVPFDPRFCVNISDHSQKNLTYAAGHPECNMFGGCAGGDCQMVPGQGFLGASNFTNCFQNGPPTAAICQANPNCGFIPECRTFVNDTAAPVVRATEARGFSNRGFIDWSTNEPSNGTVSFYKNDSTCAVLNSSVLESFPQPPPGIPFPHDFSYKPFHHVELSADAGSIGFALAGGSTYYYKTISCDPNNNCAISNCLSITADASNSFTAPKMFNFTQPAGINFQMDSGNGSYAPFSSGFQRGGKDYKIRFGSPNGTWAITLVGVDIDSNMSINFSNVFNINEGAVLIGMNSTAWLEIAQKLGADTIQLTLPGNGNKLIKCAEDGSNCADVSSLATIVSQTSGKTIWSVPVSLGFSVYSVNSTGGFTLASDKGVYGSYPSYTGGLINLSNSNASIGGNYNITVNITANISGLTFSIGLNYTNGTTYQSPIENTGSSFRWDNITLFSNSTLRFAFNVTNTFARAGIFNFTVYYLNASGGVNATAVPASPINLGAINITSADNAVANSSSPIFTFLYDSADDPSELCTLNINGVVNASNSTVNQSTLTNLTATGLVEGNYNATVVCVNDQSHADNVTALTQTFSVDTTAPSITVSSPANNSLAVGTLYINLTVQENSTLANLSLYIDGVLRNSSSVNGTNNFAVTSVAGGKHLFFLVANDSSGKITATSNYTFYFANSEDLATRGVALNTSLSPSTMYARFVYTNGTVALGSSPINNLYNLTILVNGTSNVTNITVNMTFNGSLAYWGNVVGPTLNTSNNSAGATTVGNLTLTNVSTFVYFNNFSSFINDSDYNTVSFIVPQALGSRNIFYINGDVVTLSAITRLNNCSGTNTTPASVTTAAQSCYTVTSTGFTVYTPHLSGIAVANDNVPPIIYPGLPSSAQVLNDSLVRFSFIVNETNPNSTLCTYIIANNTNVTLINTSIPLANFTYLSNYSLNYTVNISNQFGSDNLTMNITCADIYANAATSSFRFIINDTTYPEIQSATNTSGASSITLGWSTSEGSNRSINISGDNYTGQIYTTSSAYALSHSATITGLASNKVFAYTITSCDRSGNCAAKAGSATTTLVANNEDFTQRMGELLTTFANQVTRVNISINGTDQLGTPSINNLFNLSILVNGSTPRTNITVNLTFNGSLANWNHTIGPALTTSNNSQNATKIGNLTLTNVSTLVFFSNFSAFLNDSNYTTVAFTIPTAFVGTNVFYISNDVINSSTITRLNNCSGTNTTPVSVTTAAQSCYTVTSTSYTVYTPHLSGIAVANDNVPPIIYPGQPAVDQVFNDSVLSLNFVVNETNPSNTLCNYNITNATGNVSVNTLGSSAVTLSNFTYLTNFSLNFSSAPISAELTNGTNFTLSINCTDVNGNSATRNINFSINDTTYPNIISPSATSDTTSITVTYSTSEPSNRTINISGKTASTSSSFTLSPQSGTVSGLTAGTTYTYTIIACDRSGNCDKLDGSKATTSASSSSSSSSGGGGGGGTTPSAPTSISQTWAVLNPDLSTSVLPGSSAIAVSEIDFKLTQTANNAKFDVSSLGTTAPAGTNLPTGYTIFQYIDFVTTNIPEANIKEATVKFVVNKTWLTSNNIQDANVYLLRYVNGVWVPLTTQVLFSGDTSVTYLASTPGFSHFAIGGKPSAASATAPSPPPPSTVGNETTGQNTPEQTNKTGAGTVIKKTSKPIIGPTTFWIIALVVIVAVVGIYFFLTQKKGEKLKL